jgi:regulatory protein
MEGRITSIQRQKNDNRRASIFLDEQFAFGVNEETIEHFRLRKGDYIEVSLHQQIADFDYGIDAKRIALRYINYRARSEKEIRERLAKEDIPDDIVARVLEFLKDHNFVNDESWSRSFVNDKLSRKPVSSRQLEYGLAQKGVAKEVIAETLAELNAVESDEERARKAAEKQWPKILRREDDPRKQKQKLYTFLASRGFSFPIIEDVFRTLQLRDDGSTLPGDPNGD